ncbi:MAG TPA: permease [Armatimonadetes bacterium]|nr:permease [Armatimonadota bacterium]
MDALRVAWRVFIRMAPLALAVVGVIGLLHALVPPTMVSALLGRQSGHLGVLSAAFAGAVVVVPGVVAFPFAASLLRAGAAVAPVAAFVTTFVMVSIATIPLEGKLLGMRFALLRNSLAFLLALIIAYALGWMLK